MGKFTAISFKESDEQEIVKILIFTNYICIKGNFTREIDLLKLARISRDKNFPKFLKLMASVEEIWMFKFKSE